MPLLTKRAVFRRTRELLNDSGLHWIQGDYIGMRWLEDKQKEIKGRCLMGGLQEILFGDANVTRPEKDDPATVTLYRETTEELAQIIRQRFPSRIPRHASPADVVISFNDHRETTWEDVDSVLSVLALEKAKKATPPSSTGPTLGTAGW